MRGNMRDDGMERPQGEWGEPQDATKGRIEDAGHLLHYARTTTQDFIGVLHGALRAVGRLAGDVEPRPGSLEQAWDYLADVEIRVQRVKELHERAVTSLARWEGLNERRRTTLGP